MPVAKSKAETTPRPASGADSCGSSAKGGNRSYVPEIHSNPATLSAMIEAAQTTRRDKDTVASSGTTKSQTEANDAMPPLLAPMTSTRPASANRSEEHTSELQSHVN